MKMTEQHVERTGDKISVFGTFVNKWRKPARISIAIEEGWTPVPVISGDVKETVETVNCIAQIAWDMGWRPAGLAGALNHIILNHKIPKP